MQSASGNPNGIYGSFGGRNRTSWVRARLSALFAAGGPLELFNNVQAPEFMRKIRACQDLVRVHYDRDHSHDKTGVLGEDVPHWMEWWFCLSAAGIGRDTGRRSTPCAG